MAVLAALLAPYREGLRGLDRRVGVLVFGTLFFLSARIGIMTYLGIHLHRDVGIPIAVVGAAFLVENLCRGLAAPIVGAFSDRIGRRPLIIGSVVASAFVLPTFLLVTDATGLFVWSIVVGFAQGGYFPASSSLLLDLAPPDRRQSVLALNYTMLSLGYVLGVVPSGFLAGVSYVALAAASSCALLLVAVIAAVGLRGPLPDTGGQRGAFTLGLPFRDPTFLAFAALALAFPLSVGLMALTVPIYASEAGGLSESMIGLVLAPNGLVIGLFALPANVRLERSGPFRLLAASTIPLVACFGLLALGATIPLIVVATVTFSVGEIIFSAAAPTAVALLAPPGARGAYQGAWGFAFAAGVGSALFLSGLVRDAFDWRAAWLAAAVVMALAGLALLATRARFRRIAQARADAAERPASG